MEVRNINDLNKGVELHVTKKIKKSNSLLILALSVDLAGQTHTNATRDVANTLAPDILVDSCVDNDLLGVHGLLSELADHIHGTRSLSLKSTKRRVRDERNANGGFRRTPLTPYGKPCGG